MIFADLFFIYFFMPLCLAMYFATKKTKYRNRVLIGFSLVFYAWGEPVWVFILLLSSVINYYAALAIDRNKSTSKAKMLMALVTIWDLGVLFCFKYIGFFVGNFNSWFGLSIPVPKITLPIGISFYTFQTLSYVIDVYRAKVPVQKTYSKLLLYISLFPQLVAGPIVRYSTIAEEIDRRKISLKDISDGVSRIILGLGKKVIIANSISTIVESLFGKFEDGYEAMSNVTVLGTWYGAVLVGLWYYYDFSGYSDMAIGMGRIFGFHFDENFKYPYICTSITEFWRRWHISLSSWFRDYVYIPLGGSRRGPLTVSRNLMIVWLLTGFWHGGTANFIIWGLVLGILIVWEKFVVRGLIERIPLIGHLHVIILIPLTWVIFAITDLKELKVYFTRLFPFFGTGVAVNHGDFAKYIGIYWPFFTAAILLCVPVFYNLLVWKRKNPVVILFLLAVFWVSVYFASISAGNPFMYFSF